MVQIIVAAISGICTLVGVIITAVWSNKRTTRAVDNQYNAITVELSRQQAITETKLEELTREVREHNNFARRVPVIEEQIKIQNRRLTAAERKVDCLTAAERRID